MITKLIPVNDQNNELVGYREIASAQPAQNAPGMVVYTYPVKNPLFYSFTQYNELPDLSVLENNQVQYDESIQMYWIVK